MADEVKPNSQGALPGDLSPGQDGIKNVNQVPPDVGKEAPKPKEEEKKPDDKVVVPPVKKEEETKTPEDDKWKNEYVTLDHPSGQAAIDLLKESGVTPVEANVLFEEAIKTGDLTKVKWDQLEAKIGKGKALLVKNGIEAYYNDVGAKNTKTRDAVFEIMGGEANWTKVKLWAQAAEKVDPTGEIAEEVSNARKALDLGGTAGKEAAKRLKTLYEADKSNKGLGVTTLVKGDSVAKAAGDPLSRADYLTAMKKLHATGYSAAEEAKLNSRRKAGMEQGLR